MRRNPILQYKNKITDQRKNQAKKNYHHCLIAYVCSLYFVVDVFNIHMVRDIYIPPRCQNFMKLFRSENCFFYTI